MRHLPFFTAFFLMGLYSCTYAEICTSKVCEYVFEVRLARSMTYTVGGESRLSQILYNVLSSKLDVKNTYINLSVQFKCRLHNGKPFAFSWHPSIYSAMGPMC